MFSFLKSGATETPAFAPNPKEQALDIDLLGMVFRYKWRLLFGFLAGLALGLLLYFRAGPAYEAKGQVVVSKPTTVPIKSRSLESENREERGGHIALITSPLIVSMAVENYNLRELPSLQDSGDPVGDIIDELSVSRTAGKDSSFLNIVDIGYQNPNREDAIAIAQAMINAYGDYLRETAKEHSTEVFNQILTASKKLMKDIQTKETEYVKFQASSPLFYTNRGLSGNDKATNVHKERLLAIEEEYEKMMLKEVQIRSAEIAILASRTKGVSEEALEMMVRDFISTQLEDGVLIVGGNSGGASSASITAELELERKMALAAELDGELLPLIVEERKLARDFGPRYPPLQDVRESIEMVLSFYRERGVDVPKYGGRTYSPLTSTVPEELKLVNVYLRFLQQQKDALEYRKGVLNDLFDEESRAAKDDAHYIAKDRALTEELEDLRELRQITLERLKEVDIARGSEGYRLKQIGGIGSKFSIKRPIKFIAAGCFMGLVLALGLAYWQEWRDTSLKSIEDVRRRLNIPVLGGIPNFTPFQGGSHLACHASLCYLHLPGSLAAEAYRSVRTALFTASANANAQVFQVTSPERGDGKSVFISNLAIASAQAGKKVLLVDADLRDPGIANLFSARHDIGTADVLAGEIDLLNAIQPTTIEGLSLLTTRSTGNHAAELLSTVKLVHMIEEARREFDFILIDSPPLLAVSDPCIISPSVDGLILLVKLNKNERASLERAQELVDTHGIDVMGVVVNGIEGLSGRKSLSFSIKKTTSQRTYSSSGFNIISRPGFSLAR